MLGSDAMSELIEAVKDEYDVILVDSPPLAAGVDPFILGTLTGAAVLVVRTGHTDREMAEAKLRLLDRLPIRIIGVVLNAVPTHGAYSYYSYLSGYETRDEVPAAPDRELVPGLG